MSRKKSVTIPEELWTRIQYHFQCDDANSENIEAIKRLILEKQQAQERREQYTQYKTGATEEERERARRDYLDAVGIPNSFRW